MVETWKQLHTGSVLAVVGDSGEGKTSFINFLTGTNGDKGVVGEEKKSCTQGVKVFKSERGDLTFIDTQGTNDTENDDNQTILLAIMEEFLVTGKEINNVHGILFIQTANHARDYSINRMQYWSKIFGKEITNNVIYVWTKFNDLSNKKQQEILKQVEIEKQKGKRILLWDSTDPVQDQDQEFKTLIKQLNPIPFSLLSDKDIQTRAEKLRLKDTIAVDESKVKPQIRHQTIDVVHEETASRSGFISILTLGISKLKSVTHTKYFDIVPSYTPNTVSRRILMYEVNYVEDADVRRVEWTGNGKDRDRGDLCSRMTTSYSQFGTSKIKYNINVEFEESFKLSEVDFQPRHKTIEPYMTNAKRELMMEKIQKEKV